jgi:hypothetical protein
VQQQRAKRRDFTTHEETKADVRTVPKILLGLYDGCECTIYLRVGSEHFEGDEIVLAPISSRLERGIGEALLAVVLPWIG